MPAPTNYDGIQFCALPDNVQGARAGDLCRWTKNELTYLFANEWPPALQMADVARAFRLACDRWQKVANVRFRQVTQGPADIAVYSRPMGGPGGVLAEAQLQCPAGARPLWCRFDNTENWVIADNPGQAHIDLTRVMCHELGHILGIGHIAGPNLMAPNYSTRIKDPQVGDIAEIVARMGTPLPPVDEPEPPSDPPQPPTGDNDFFLVKFPRDWLVVPEE